MSSSVVSEHWNSSRSIIDHWRALRLSEVSSVFDLSNKQDMLMYWTRPDTSSTVSYCDELSADCHNGFYQSPQCRRQHPDNCAVLLSSYPGNHLYLHSLVIKASVHLHANLPLLYFTFPTPCTCIALLAAC